MKTLLTKAILLLLLAVAAVPCLAQQRGTVSFNYDENGNRTARTISFVKSRGGSDTQGDPNAELATPMLASATDELAGLRLTLYPNPTEGRFSVGIAGMESGEHVRATVTTVTGEVLYDKIIAEQSTEFDLDGHPAGIYLLRLAVRSESQVWKVIKK